MTDDSLNWLMHWYLSQCDGDWEHSYGVKLDNLDNPGWTIKIDLRDTDLEHRPFARIERGEPADDLEEWKRTGSWWVADVKGKEVCSVTGSTSLDNIEAEGAKPVGFDTYSECVEKVLDGTVEAMSTDGTILAGYAAQNEGELKVVGEQFSEERIGVGYSKDRPEMCQWIVDTITAAYEDGTYEEAFNATLGPSGVEVPELPEMDPCE